jgi:Holliday junction DNA helicase RuvA
MYESIEGKLTHLSPEYAVIETNGIGYKIFIPLNLFTNALKLSESVKLFTALIVREDDMRLFGFQTRSDLELFQTLTSISGIGPKTAITIIGHIDLEDFENSIKTANIPKLSKIPGIGKKSAERLILELKDKLKLKKDNSKEKCLTSDLTEDATQALIRLGYNQKIAENAIRKAIESSKDKEPESLAKLITCALKNVN